MFYNFDFDVIERSWYYLITTGLKTTLILTFWGMVGGIVLGTALAMMRLSSSKALSWTATGYVNLMRSVPLVLVIFWFYFLVPYIAGWVTGAGMPIPIGGFHAAIVTFVLFEAAYYCEILRSGIQSIPRGQVAAGYALGMSYWQMMANIVLPQAFRTVMPILMTQTIILFQDVSLVYVLGSVQEFVTIANKVAQRDGRLVEMYMFVAVVYFVLCFALSQLVKRFQNKIAIIR
jgi:glutamate/aspartate transport system permease protein